MLLAISPDEVVATSVSRPIWMLSGSTKAIAKGCKPVPDQSSGSTASLARRQSSMEEDLSVSRVLCGGTSDAHTQQLVETMLLSSPPSGR